MRLFIGGACGIGKGAVARSLASTLKNLDPEASIRVIEDPVEEASKEKGFTFERMCARRLYVRAPDLCEEMIYDGLDRMCAGNETYVIVNESPFAFLGYCTYFGFLACFSLKRRNEIIKRFLDAGMADDSRHLFLQPWAVHQDTVSRTLNTVVIPYIALAGNNGEVIPTQADRNATVKAGSMAGLNILGIRGGDA